MSDDLGVTHDHHAYALAVLVPDDFFFIRVLVIIFSFWEATGLPLRDWDGTLSPGVIVVGRASHNTNAPDPAMPHPALLSPPSEDLSLPAAFLPPGHSRRQSPLSSDPYPRYLDDFTRLLARAFFVFFTRI